MTSTDLEALKWVLIRAAIAAALIVIGFALGRWGC
jgi:prolipoprotein diacylglyceryltransferase